MRNTGLFPEQCCINCAAFEDPLCCRWWYPYSSPWRCFRQMTLYDESTFIELFSFQISNRHNTWDKNFRNDCNDSNVSYLNFPPISASVMKLDEYLESLKTKFYALAIGKSKIMFLLLLVRSHKLNCSHQPTIKFKWLRRIGQNLTTKSETCSRHRSPPFFPSCFLFMSHPQMIEYERTYVPRTNAQVKYSPPTPTRRCFRRPICFSFCFS